MAHGLTFYGVAASYAASRPLSIFDYLKRGVTSFNHANGIW